jgi:hypothetical protein
MDNTPNNLQSPSYLVNNYSTTGQFFNNFFTADYNISPDANDAIVSFFERTTDNVESAQALAAAVIYTSLSQQVDPMIRLQEFSQLPPGDLNEYLALFLNLNRVGSSLLGVSITPVTNPYVTRTILP